MSHEARVENQVFFVFHAPGRDRLEAGQEVCDALERANPAILGPQGSSEWAVEAWFLASPDLAFIDGNDRQTDQTTLALADGLHAPGCHAILVGFDTLAPPGVPPARVARRAMGKASELDRYAPTEVGADAAPERHLVDALVARAARLTVEEKIELMSRVDRTELPTYSSMEDFDRGPGHIIAPPGLAPTANRAWSRAVAALGAEDDAPHPYYAPLEFAVGAAAGALALRSQIGGWQRWGAAEYLALTRPWRETIGPLHSDDASFESIAGATPGLHLASPRHSTDNSWPEV